MQGEKKMWILVMKDQKGCFLSRLKGGKFCFFKRRSKRVVGDDLVGVFIEVIVFRQSSNSCIVEWTGRVTPKEKETLSMKLNRKRQEKRERGAQIRKEGIERCELISQRDTEIEQLRRTRPKIVFRSHRVRFIS